MTREEYIKFKESSPIELIYIYYRDKFDFNKHKPELTKNQLMMYLQGYTDVNIILNKVVSDYDVKFDVRLLLDSNGKYVKSV